MILAHVNTLRMHLHERWAFTVTPVSVRDWWSMPTHRDKKHCYCLLSELATVQNSTTTYKVHLEDFLVSEMTLFYLFLLAAEPSCLWGYVLIKCLLVFFPAAVGIWQESRRQIWQDSCGETWMSFIVLLWTLEISPWQTNRQTGRQTDTWVVRQPEPSTAEVPPPLLLDVFFQGTVEDEYEQTWRKTERGLSKSFKQCSCCSVSIHPIMMWL